MRFAIAALVLILAPSFALAGELIATAPAVQAVPAAAAVPLLPEKSAEGPDNSSGVRAGPCGPQKVTADGKADTSLHGFVEGGVGTRGYRHIAAGACKPLANGGALAVSVSQTQVQEKRFGY